MNGPYRGFVELPLAVLDSLRSVLDCAATEIVRQASPLPYTPPRTNPLTAAVECGVLLTIVREMAPKCHALGASTSALERATDITAWCQCNRKARVAVTDNALEDVIAPVDLILRCLESLAGTIANCHCVPKETDS